MEVKFDDMPRLIGEMYVMMKELQERIGKLELTGTGEQEDELLDFEKAAEMLRLTERTLYRKTAKKEIPFSKCGKLIYFSRNDLLEYVKNGAVKTKADVARNAKAFVENMSRKRF